MLALVEDTISGWQKDATSRVYLDGRAAEGCNNETELKRSLSRFVKDVT